MSPLSNLNKAISLRIYDSEHSQMLLTLFMELIMSPQF